MMTRSGRASRCGHDGGMRHLDGASPASGTPPVRRRWSITANSPSPFFQVARTPRHRLEFGSDSHHLDAENLAAAGLGQFQATVIGRRPRWSRRGRPSRRPIWRGRPAPEKCPSCSPSVEGPGSILQPRRLSAGFPVFTLFPRSLIMSGQKAFRQDLTDVVILHEHIHLSHISHQADLRGPGVPPSPTPVVGGSGPGSYRRKSPCRNPNDLAPWR